MTNLHTRLKRGEIILLDGGTGTELEVHGVPMDDEAWSGAAVLTHAALVRTVHEAYIQAGADIIITNSYGASKHVLRHAKLADKFRFINSEAVKLAQQAIENVAQRPITIAGAISTTTFGKEQPPAAEAQANFTEQVEILAEGGVDLIILEMMRDIEYTNYALQAAHSVGLPVWLGLSSQQADDGTPLLWNRQHTLAEGMAAFDLSRLDLVALMHTLTEEIEAALTLVKRYWSGKLGVYAHSGEFIMPRWQFHNTISPEAYALAAQKWVRQGVQVVGGCCGIRPAHIAQLKAQLPSQIGRV